MIFLGFFQVAKTLFIIIIIIIAIKENDNRDFIKQFSLCDFLYNGRLPFDIFRVGDFGDFLFNFD